MRPREQAVAAIAAGTFDVLVIGGGITGAGVALDAASRGLRVALVEQADYASGTSGRSSKLVHGGLRYLRSFDLGLVREALAERALMVALAPQLVRPLPFVVPAFEGAHPDRVTGIGLNLYDLLAGSWLPGRARRRPLRPLRAVAGAGAGWSAPRHRLISGAEVARLLPAIAPRRPTGGYLFHDCQTDDARLVLTVLGEAERFGAICANRLRVVRLATESGRQAGATVVDSDTGESLEVRAHSVVNATGVWADRLGCDGAPDDATSPAGGAERTDRSASPGLSALPRLVPSRGVHVVVAHADLPLSAGAIVPAGDGRSLFAVPWLGRSLIGTTDREHEGELDHVPPVAADVEYLLDAVNRLFGTGLARRHVAAAYAGVRPLIAGGGGRRSVDISRRARLYESSGGLITITGGKLTTWRRMAKLAVDRVVARDGRQAACRTQEIPLGGIADPAALPRVAGVPDRAYEMLAGRYGRAAGRVLALAAEHPELAQPILSGLPDLLAEAAFAARDEQARSVGDVLLRRTRLGLLAARELCAPGGEGPRRVAEAMAGALGWDRARVAAEADGFRAEAAAEGLVLDCAGLPDGAVAGH